MKKILPFIAIIAVLLTTIVLLVMVPGGARPAPVNSRKITDAEVRESWYGVFIQGERIGYTFVKTTKTDSGLVIENRSQMTIMMMGMSQSMATLVSAHTDPEYALLDFSAEITTAGHTARFDGTIEGTTLTLTSEIQGVKKTETRELKEKPYFHDAVEDLLKARGMKPGDAFSIPYFDPVTQAAASARITVIGRESVTMGAETRDAMRVEIDFMGFVSVLWIADDYRLIKETVPSMGMEMIPMSKEEALAEISPDESFDLLGFFSVKLAEPIPGQQDLAYIKLALEDIETSDLNIVDDFQRIASASPLLLELERPDLNQFSTLSLPVAGQDDFLKSSVYVLSDHPEIIRTAQSMIGKETNAREATRLLVDGVYRMIDKKPTPSMPTALDVLRTKEGDCNEHAVLFCALARAVGIPTKIYVGLVNLYGDAYYYHAWCAVWLGKWVPVDPTFDQFPADLYHLKLQEGEVSEWASVMNVVGKLKIRVVEYR